MIDAQFKQRENTKELRAPHFPVVCTILKMSLSISFKECTNILFFVFCVRLSADLGPPLVSAEVEMHCIREAAHFIADFLAKSVGPEKSMFASKIAYVLPGK